MSSPLKCDLVLWIVAGIFEKFRVKSNRTRFLRFFAQKNRQGYPLNSARKGMSMAETRSATELI